MSEIHQKITSRTIEKQLARMVRLVFVLKCWWEPQRVNASFSWIVKVLVWRRISAGFPVPNPLWTHVAWEYQKTGLGASLNLYESVYRVCSPPLFPAIFLAIMLGWYPRWLSRILITGENLRPLSTGHLSSWDSGFSLQQIAVAVALHCMFTWVSSWN